MATPISWSSASGQTQYKTVPLSNQEYAVPERYSLDTEEDKQHCFLIKLDKQTKAHFFVNAATRETTWDLPDPPARFSPGFRERIVRFYEHYNPTKVANVDRVLASYTPAREAALIQSLVEKYGAEPPAPPAPVAQSSGNPSSATSELGKSTPAVSEHSVANNSIVSASSNGGNGRTYLERVQAIYRAYKPAKLHKAENDLKKNVGHEEELIAALVARHGPEPPATPRPEGDAAAVAQAPSTQQQTPSTTAVAQPAVNEQEEKNEPAPSSTGDLVRRIEAMWKLHRANKMDKLQETLSKYSGNEQALLDFLVEKYGAEPAQENKKLEAEPAKSDQAQSRALESGHETEASAVATDTPMNNAEPQAQSPQESSGGAQEDTTPSPGNKNDNTFDFGRVPKVDLTTIQNSPMSVKQDMLLQFLNDREERLRDALQRNEQATATVEALRDANTKLSMEIDSIRVQNAEELKSLKLGATAAKEKAEALERSWELGRAKADAAAEVARVAAERSLNTQRIQHEEERVAQLKALSDTRAALSAVEYEAKVGRDRSAELLASLDRRETELRRVRDELKAAEDAVNGPPKVPIGIQTDETLEEIVAGVMKERLEFMNMGANDVSNERSLSAGSQVKYREHSIRCTRCGKEADVSCHSCRSKLCRKCDKIIHATNARFAMHQRPELPPIRRHELPAPNCSAIPTTGQRSLFPPGGSSDIGESPAAASRRMQETLDDFDDVVKQEMFRREEIDQFRSRVEWLESEIQRLQDELSDEKRATLEAQRVKQCADCREKQHIISNLKVQGSKQDQRIAELEMRLLSLPGTSPRNLSSDAVEAPPISESERQETEQLKKELASLASQLTDSKKIVKEQRKEINSLRGLLSMHMAAPYGSVHHHRHSPQASPSAGRQ